MTTIDNPRIQWATSHRHQRVLLRHARAPQERIERRTLWVRMYNLLASIKDEERAAIETIHSADWRMEQVKRYV